MSAKVSGAVWDADLDRVDKYILLSLADHAGHDGRDIYPSIGFIAWKTGYDERQIRRRIRGFEERGILIREDRGVGGRGKATHYRLNIEALPKRAPYDSIKADIQKSAFIGEYPDIVMSGFTNPDISEKADILNTNPDISTQNPDILRENPDIAMSAEPMNHQLEPSKKPSREKSAKRAHPLPEDFEPPYAWARNELGLSEQFVNAEMDKMRDWALSKGERKVDWQATARNWLRRAVEQQPRSNGNGSYAPTPGGDPAMAYFLSQAEGQNQ